MMKVSDPIIFGHAVRAFFADLFESTATRCRGRRQPNDGLGALCAIERLPTERAAIAAAIDGAYAAGPALAMVDSDRGITNLHVPSDVIIDASMPAAIRASGRCGTPTASMQDTKFVIPDHSYAALYAETRRGLPRHGAFDPATMGSTPNVGLMAQAAEEYGSHDKTFEIAAAGKVRVVDAAGHDAARAQRRGRATSGACARPRTRRSGTGFSWRSTRARATGAPAVFWLDATEPHDASCSQKVRPALAELDTDGPARSDPGRRRSDAVHARARPRRRGHDLGHGQRAARLPDRPVPDPRARHQRQDALDRAADERRRAVRDRGRRLGAEARAAVRQGGPPALGFARRVPGARAVSFELLAEKTGNPRAKLLADTLDRATGTVLEREPLPVAAGSASSTTAAATSTWLSIGPRSWPRRPRTWSWRSASSWWPSARQPTRRRSSRSWRFQGKPVEIGGYYRPIWSSSRPRCGRRRPSTPRSKRSAQ